MNRIIVVVWLTALGGSHSAWAQDTGDTGDTGNTGTAGSTGDTGITGGSGTTGDTGTGDEPPLSKDDDDDDGYSPFQGDCDDTNREVFPNAEELCFDRIDNNCNGLFDEACDGRVQTATLRGGGGCTGGTGVGNTSFVLLPLLLLFRRRA